MNIPDLEKNNKIIMELPRDENSVPLQIFRAQPALATTRNTNITAATNLILNTSTRTIRISAENQGICLKFGTGVTTADNGYDAYIPAGQTFDFGVNGSYIGSTISFIEIVSGAIITVTQLA